MALGKNATSVIAESMDANDVGGVVSDGGDTPTSDTGVIRVVRTTNGKAAKRKHANNVTDTDNGKRQIVRFVFDSSSSSSDDDEWTERVVACIGENNLRISCVVPIGQAPQKKRVKRNGDAAADKGPQTKNTVALLNELRKNVIYEVESQSGPVHAPIFTMSVLVSTQI